MADVANGSVGFYYNGDGDSSKLPTFNLTVTKAGTTPLTSGSFQGNVVFVNSALAAESTGGKLFYGDGSGKGGYASTSTLSGTNGAGGGDSFTGTDFNDVIFGDGSGGGEGTSNSSGGFKIGRAHV